ncbi:unnamed protein product [Arctogadus glacialis]
MDGLDAAVFLQTWQHFDPEDKGFIEDTELDGFLQHAWKTTGKQVESTTVHPAGGQRQRGEEPGEEERRARSLQGRLQRDQLAAILLPAEESFLFGFRRVAPLDDSVKFMRIWRNYDADSSGFISAAQLKGFLRDLLLHHRHSVTPGELEEYTGTMVKIFDPNGDGRLDLNDMARILSLKENFLLKFKMDACSLEDRMRDFEKIFAHYDVSGTGALEGPEVDGFVRDMMELVKPGLRGADLDHFRTALLGHCDLNQDGKIQKNELALCLGLRLG